MNGPTVNTSIDYLAEDITTMPWKNAKTMAVRCQFPSQACLE